MKHNRKYDDAGQKREDKLASLLSYRKAKGMCYKCGDKWGKGYTCPAQVPLHIVEELMSPVHLETWQPTLTEDSDLEEELEFMEVHEAQKAEQPKN
jgi:hypothetical protein